MQRKSVNILILLAFVAVCATGFWLLSGMSEDGVDDSTQVSAVESIQDNSLTGNYLSGRIARNRGDVKNSARYLEQALKKDPENKELLAQTIRAYLVAGDLDAAIRNAQALQKLDPKAMFAHLLIALGDVKKGDYAKAREAITLQQNEELSAVLMPLITAWIDLGESKLKKPVELEEALQRMELFAPFLYYQLALINDVAGFDEKALDQYSKAVNQAAKMPYRVVEALGNYYERHGMMKEAKALYDRYHEESPDSTLFLSPAKEPLKPEDRLVKNPVDGIAEVFFSIASIFYTEDSMEEALVHLRMALYLKPDLPPAQLMLGNTLERMDDSEGALEVYAGIDPKSPFYQKAQLRTAYVHDVMGNESDALRELDDLAKSAPDRYEALMIKGDLLRKHDKYAEAAKAYTEAIGRVPMLKRYHWSMLYARGIAYERSGDWAHAEKDFLKALDLEPGQPDVLNYLGYSWLVIGKNISEARGMIEQAISKRPSDAHIIDSMGWALYAQGEFEESLRYLERAAELTPDDPTVNDHLGDVYWRLGRYVEARYQWEKALVFKPEAKDEANIRRKLQDGLPAMQAPATPAESKEKSAAAETSTTQ